MGPQGDDPVCPCAMRKQGLQPHNSWSQEKIEELEQALSNIYNRRYVNNESDSLE